jgi:membrane protein implicated in regulation of membrane protease activity
MPQVIKNQSLTIVMFALFLFSAVGMIATGERHYNEEQREHGQPVVGVAEYLTTGAFVEAFFENWESEFLQMGLYVLLTAYFYQKGSAESKDPDSEEAVDADPRQERDRPDTPGPVKRGGLALKLYENSLALALLALFVISFALHVAGGAADYNEDQQEHGGETISTLGYLATSRMWFESFQNWQSEFISVAAVVVLSIFLRQRGSPESKPVAAAHSETGAS